MSSFDKFGLPAQLQKALQKMNFNQPTPIQNETIPVAIERKDLIGCAQTGTGKTAAFAIPLVTQAILDPNKNFLILAPTRELAAQIREVIMELSQCSRDIRTALIVGGAMMRRQFQALSKDPSFLIATPGRLMDHVRRGSIELSNTSTLVLDEADRMLDMGFGPQIEEILQYLPKERQTLLFSATLPPKIKKLAEKFLTDPKHIQVGNLEVATPKVEQSFVKVENLTKNDMLLTEFTKEYVKTLVFTRTKRGADKLKKFLEQNGVPAACIHGDRSQSQRDRAIADFRSGKHLLLVATDIASRGLDVDQVKLVINYDLPETAEDYIHRIGRTGRAGQTGKAISFVRGDEMSHWKYLQNPKGETNSDSKKSKFSRRRKFRPSKRANFKNQIRGKSKGNYENRGRRASA